MAYSLEYSRNRVALPDRPFSVMEKAKGSKKCQKRREEKRRDEMKRKRKEEKRRVYNEIYLGQELYVSSLSLLVCQYDQSFSKLSSYLKPFAHGPRGKVLSSPPLMYLIMGLLQRMNHDPLIYKKRNEKKLTLD